MGSLHFSLREHTGVVQNAYFITHRLNAGIVILFQGLQPFVPRQIRRQIEDNKFQLLADFFNPHRVLYVLLTTPFFVRVDGSFVGLQGFLNLPVRNGALNSRGDILQNFTMQINLTVKHVTHLHNSCKLFYEVWDVIWLPSTGL
ncbi:hypothetical protein D3C85_894070 [compost metagenome]